MPTFNTVIIKGNLTAKPELAYTTQGTPVAKATIAVNEKFKNAKKELVERVGFFDLVIWNKLAEICAENLDKGQEIIIDGRLRYEHWQDKENQPHSKIRIIVSGVYFGRKSTHSADKSSPAGTEPGTPPPPFDESQADEDIPS